MAVVPIRIVGDPVLHTPTAPVPVAADGSLPADLADLITNLYDTMDAAFGVGLAANQIGGLPEWVRQPPGVQTAYQLADAIRFETIHDYEDWIVRLESFGGYVDQVITLLRRGIQEKRVNPEIIMQRVPPQVRKQIVDDPKQSGFFSPVTRFPANVATTEQRRLSAAAEAAIVRSVVPAMRRFHDFLTDDYRTRIAHYLPNHYE